MWLKTLPAPVTPSRSGPGNPLKSRSLGHLFMEGKTVTKRPSLSEGACAHKCTCMFVCVHVRVCRGHRKLLEKSRCWLGPVPRGPQRRAKGGAKLLFQHQPAGDCPQTDCSEGKGGSCHRGWGFSVRLEELWIHHCVGRRPGGDRGLGSTHKAKSLWPCYWMDVS